MFDKLFKKTKYIRVNQQEVRQSFQEPRVDPNVPDDMYMKCKACGSLTYKGDLLKDRSVCGHCGHHFRVRPSERICSLVDQDSFEELFSGVAASNPLTFDGYDKKVKKQQDKTETTEAVLTGIGQIDGRKAAIGVMDPAFMMGSMGSAVGEKITRLVEKATEEQLPVVLVAASGGARMQEGIFSLMQMAKTSMALKRHSNAGNLYISILTDPTTGGVTASFAMLGDIILAEPGALIGFAGPRVIEQTIRQKLPEGFQRAEFLLEKGFVDRVVPREEMRTTLSTLLRVHERKAVNGQ